MVFESIIIKEKELLKSKEDEFEGVFVKEPESEQESEIKKEADILSLKIIKTPLKSWTLTQIKGTRFHQISTKVDLVDIRISEIEGGFLTLSIGDEISLQATQMIEFHYNAVRRFIINNEKQERDSAYLTSLKAANKIINL